MAPTYISKCSFNLYCACILYEIELWTIHLFICRMYILTDMLNFQSIVFACGNVCLCCNELAMKALSGMMVVFFAIVYVLLIYFALQQAAL